MPLKNKKIIIIGGSSGIGLAVAKAALKKGADVVIASRSEEKLAKAKADLSENVETYTIDMLQEESIIDFFKKVGPFDHLQLTAAEVQFGDMDALSIADARHFIRQQILGTLHGC